MDLFLFSNTKQLQNKHINDTISLSAIQRITIGEMKHENTYGLPV